MSKCQNKKYSYSYQLPITEEGYQELLGPKGTLRSKFFPNCDVLTEVIIILIQQLIDHVDNHGECLNEMQQKFLFDIFDKLLAEEDLQESTEELSEDVIDQFEHRDSLNLYKASLGLLYKLSYKIGNLKYLSEVNNKYIRNQKLLEQGQELCESEKITLFEAGLINRFGGVYEDVMKYFSEFLDYGSDNANILKDNINLHNNLFYKFNSMNLEEKFDGVGIIFWNVDKGMAYTNNERLYELGLEEFGDFGIFGMINYNHTILLMNNKNNLGEDVNVASHHLFTGYSREIAKLKNIIIGDIFEIDITKLVSAKYTDLLKETYGDEWSCELQKLFEHNIKAIHYEYSDKFSQLHHDEMRFDIAVMTDMLPKLGHDLGYEQDISKHDFNPNHLVRCAEFVVKVILLALVDLNNTLSQRLGLANDVLDIAFLKQENIHNIHADRFMKIFSHCLKKIDLMPTLYKEMVSNQQHHGFIKEEDVFVRSYNKIKKLAIESSNKDDFILAAQKVLYSYIVAGEFKDFDTKSYIESFYDRFMTQNDEEHFENSLKQIKDFGIKVDEDNLQTPEFTKISLRDRCVDRFLEKNFNEMDIFKSIFANEIFAYKDDVEYYLSLLDEHGNSLLHYAAANNHIEIAQFLISKGMRIDFINDRGQSALDVAKAYHADDFISFLEGIIDSQPEPYEIKIFEPDYYFYDIAFAA